jgi:diaminohydroxyphosphoribosylaminopyrimidine deaminase/5-amino-6-(5-phosphoribosylamino)uracil reductase
MTEPGPYMTRALELAREMAGRVSPGASVGCVIVKDGRVVAEGRYEGSGPHAEAVALAQAGDAARGATVYTTLEPCAHHGNTPPCADALVAARVAEVRFSHIDPDPRVSGQGNARLENAGIRVLVGEGEDEARKINEGFIKHRTTGRPFVIAKFAASLDGKIAATSGESRWVSGPQTLEWSQSLRQRIDAIAVGVETVVVDNPQLTARIAGPEPADAQLADHQPLRVVLDSKGRTLSSANVLAPSSRPSTDPSPSARERGSRGEGGVLIATTDASPKDWRCVMTDAGAEVELLPADASGRVNLPSLLDLLGARGVLNLLIEGGGVLHGSFFDQRLVDKVHAVIAPMIIGGSAATAVAGQGAERMADALRLRDVTVDRLGDDVLITGYL